MLSTFLTSLQRFRNGTRRHLCLERRVDLVGDETSIAAQWFEDSESVNWWRGSRVPGGQEEREEGAVRCAEENPTRDR